MIIAEIGINHNGNLDLAKQLIDKAKWAGADVAKFQTFWNIARLKEYEFKKEEWIEIKEYCDNKEITFASTPHTFNAIHFLEDLVPFYKIAHTYISLPNFLIEIANKGKPILVSTGNIFNEDGMATDEEILNTLKYLEDCEVTLMHCVSKYPCNDPHYERIDELKELGYPVGLSDHSREIKLPKGLPVYEKHLMLKDMDCIDRKVSITPKVFKYIVKRLNE